MLITEVETFGFRDTKAGIKPAFFGRCQPYSEYDAKPILKHAVLRLYSDRVTRRARDCQHPVGHRHAEHGGGQKKGL
jgi:hypothetical protein